jgi:plastocyanin
MVTDETTKTAHLIKPTEYLMNIKKSTLTALLMAVGLIAMIAATACGGGDPEELDLPVSITGGVMDPGTIKVKQGDMVTLKINADEGGEFHLHTYDIEADIPAATVTDFYFVAEATGRFKITYHAQNEEHEEETHGGIFKSHELAPGSSFSYEVDEHQADEMIPFHSHLRPALNGTIMVSQEPGQIAEVSIEYTEEAAEPHEVMVGPGTVITWTNNSSVPQTVISGLHADMVMEDDGDHDNEMEMDEEEEHDEGEEIEIGFLEVQPR